MTQFAESYEPIASSEVVLDFFVPSTAPVNSQPTYTISPSDREC
jgi:hypothetical protein